MNTGKRFNESAANGKSSLIRILALLSLIALSGCAARQARAQFIGYTSPQTTQQRVFNASSCNGDTTSSPVKNIGQTVHAITYTVSGSTTSVQVWLEGSNDGTNYFQISDSGLTGYGNTNPGILTGYGYFPEVRIHIANGAGACVATVYYSGSSVTEPNPNFGVVDSASYRKILFGGAAAGSNQSTVGFLPPYGSTAGQIVFSYQTSSGPSGSTLQVTCADSALPPNAYAAGTFTLTQTLGPQIFDLPARGCSQISVAYGSGGTSTAQIFAIYVFAKPGVSLNPTCEQSIVINTATSAQIFAPPAALPFTQMHICSIDVSSGTAEAVQFTQGTGSVCGTGTANLTGAVHLAVNTPFVRTYPNAGLISTVGDNVCITVSAQTDGTITYSVY